LRNQDTSVVRAKQAISDFKKAVGDPAGLAELMVFYCECAAGFSNDVGYQDEAYFAALVRLFEQALETIAQLSATDRSPLITRLDRVRVIGHNFGYGVGTTWILCSPGIGEPDAIGSVLRKHRPYARSPKAHRAFGDVNVLCPAHVSLPQTRSSNQVSTGVAEGVFTRLDEGGGDHTCVLHLLPSTAIPCDPPAVRSF
jgi:hypothetical protein